MTITDAFVEWDDRAQTFRVYLQRDGEDEPRALRPLHRLTSTLRGAKPVDPEEARLVWDAMIYCPKDMNGDARDALLGFAKEAQAKRVAKRCNKTIAEMRAGVPIAEGVGAQAVYMMNGGAARAMFSLDMLRGQIAGS